MPSIQLETLSSFGRLAVKLDTDFSELTRLSGQLQRLEIDSDSGFEKGVKLLDQFAQHGKSISEGIQEFSKLLQEARAQSEAAVQQVAERAEAIRRRHDDRSRMQERLREVEDKVKGANASLGRFRKDGGGDYSPGEQDQIRAEFERLNEDLKKFLEDARAVKEAAREANFKTLERDAQNVVDALRASSRRVEKALGEA